MLAVYCALTMEVMGDIVASSEASRQPVDGLLLDSRVAGGILADGFNGMLSALFTNAPLSIFAQNNGGEHLGAWD
jgi:xanthine/uracil permease